MCTRSKENPHALSSSHATATCSAGDDGSVSSTTTQAAGDRVAQGATQTGFTCTGKPQQVSALAAANVNGAPFRPASL